MPEKVGDAEFFLPVFEVLQQVRQVRFDALALVDGGGGCLARYLRPPCHWRAGDRETRLFDLARISGVISSVIPRSPGQLVLTVKMHAVLPDYSSPVYDRSHNGKYPGCEQ